jgi:WD40 repeat protein
VTGSADCTARVWDLDATPAHAQSTHTGRVTGVVISGDTAITYGEAKSLIPFAYARWLQLYLHQMRVRVSGMLECESETARTLGFLQQVWMYSPNRHKPLRYIAGRKSLAIRISCRANTCAGNDEAIVWDTRKGRCQAVLRGHDASMRWAELISNGAELLTVSADCMVKRWDLHSITCRQTSPGKPSTSNAAFKATSGMCSEVE